MKIMGQHLLNFFYILARTRFYKHVKELLGLILIITPESWDCFHQMQDDAQGLQQPNSLSKVMQTLNGTWLESV